MSYVGQKYVRASPCVAGLMNDHLEIVASSGELYEGYLRRNFDKGEGPLATVKDEGALLTGKLRGWQGEPVIEPKPLEEAVEDGMRIAQEENLVLYVPSSRLGYVKIEWHPDGWKPDKEPEPVLTDSSHW